MIKIIASRGTGKTAQLLKEAKEAGAVVVCENPYALEYKAKKLNIDGLHFISYNDFFRGYNYDEKYLVDEVDELLKSMNVVGYNMSLD